MDKHCTIMSASQYIVDCIAILQVVSPDYIKMITVRDGAIRVRVRIRQGYLQYTGLMFYVSDRFMIFCLTFPSMDTLSTLLQ